MDPRLALLQQFRQVSASADEKPGLEPTKAITPTLAQMPGNPILLANNINPTMQNQNQANWLQQYFYSNYLQQLALQQQQQQPRQVSSPIFPLSFSPIQATTIPQSVLTADMNRKRKLVENMVVESAKQPHLSHYAQKATVPSSFITSDAVAPTMPSADKQAKIIEPTPMPVIKIETAQSPLARLPHEFTLEQFQLLQQLFQYSMTTTTTMPSQIETTSQNHTPMLSTNFTSPLSTVIATMTSTESNPIKQESPCEVNQNSKEMLGQSSANSSPSVIANSPSLISLLRAPVTQHGSEVNKEEEEQDNLDISIKRGRRADVDDDMVDIEVVDVVGGIPGDKSTTAIRSVQRKAHIDFYRKLKSFRNRERLLKCHLCEALVENSDNGIRSHIHLHSNAPLFVCKICQVGFKERHWIFEHLNEKHPGKNADCFEDRRDMVHLGEVLFNCFPKSNTKIRVSYQDLLKKITQYSNKEKLSTLECQLCKTKISTQRQGIVQHLHCHQSFRCKTCKFTCQNEETQIQHCMKEHNASEPKQGMEYNVCSAQEVLAGTFEQCFSVYLNNTEHET